MESGVDGGAATVTLGRGESSGLGCEGAEDAADVEEWPEAYSRMIIRAGGVEFLRAESGALIAGGAVAAALDGGASIAKAPLSGADKFAARGGWSAKDAVTCWIMSVGGFAASDFFSSIATAAGL